MKKHIILFTMLVVGSLSQASEFNPFTTGAKFLAVATAAVYLRDCVLNVDPKNERVPNFIKDGILLATVCASCARPANESTLVNTVIPVVAVVAAEALIDRIWSPKKQSQNS